MNDQIWFLKPALYIRPSNLAAHHSLIFYWSLECCPEPWFCPCKAFLPTDPLMQLVVVHVCSNLTSMNWLNHGMILTSGMICKLLSATPDNNVLNFIEPGTLIDSHWCRGRLCLPTSLIGACLHQTPADTTGLLPLLGVCLGRHAQFYMDHTSLNDSLEQIDTSLDDSGCTI